ncbi:DinB family protein [Pseudooceanicola marinus]|uniref:DinB family protein n=1 Tax=Pseudooceanicola marinus TaxID=396013 RepID=UPI001CD52B51|nr:DinB family protein [Pseudooceanicola marinus]MCA1334498.1 DinB family protein [Pseudooceanicola marinus]
MITPAYCQTMARYNTWQNDQMAEAMAHLSPEALSQDRGAFFGSILGTANHLLWADAMWLSRLTDLPKPDVGVAESPKMAPTLAAWQAERFRMDGRLRLWAEGLGALDLTGDLTWFSGSTGREERRPMAGIVMHIFNHQTHHRGQIHAMLTAAGEDPGATDLFLMPQA